MERVGVIVTARKGHQLYFLLVSDSQQLLFPFGRMTEDDWSEDCWDLDPVDASVRILEEQFDLDVWALINSGGPKGLSFREVDRKKLNLSPHRHHVTYINLQLEANVDGLPLLSDKAIASGAQWIAARELRGGEPVKGGIRTTYHTLHYTCSAFINYLLSL